ncbi:MULTISPECIES: RidA family protein [unclassified Roseitalea]|uniref:RidA family protein n=1 Tax=unclassified Roseitalea TaxID=2639107 RepID=UPI00273EFF66|nr:MULTISPECIES: RidA family protein [unclassified Roseitalea]
MTTTLGTKASPAKQVPANSVRQHATAGPYSPVLEVDARRLVVLSGQVAVAMDGSVIGNSVAEQTQATLANCADKLRAAGCDFADVFKVNAFLTDISTWDEFNAVYADAMPEPLPARTAVQAVLLPGFLVEIEMWAVKPETEAD